MKLFRLTVILVFLFSIAHFCFAETGVFPKNIVFVTHQPLSGPAKEYSDIGKSAQAYFKYVNDQGGVHGRPDAIAFQAVARSRGCRGRCRRSTLSGTRRAAAATQSRGHPTG